MNKTDYAYIATHQFKYTAKLINMLTYSFDYGYVYCLIWTIMHMHMLVNIRISMTPT